VRESEPATRIVCFGVFEVNLETAELRKQGIRIRLPGQAFQVLEALLLRPGELVTREELKQKLWPSDSFGDFEHGLNAAVNRVREALGDSSDNPRFVETLPRRGYRFIAPVESPRPEPMPSQVSSAAPAPKANTGISRRSVASISLLAIFSVAVAFSIWSLVRERARAHVRSLAVLPLQNLSGDPGQDYFAAGMTDELITELAHIQGLRVVSRTSAVLASQSQKSLSQIADALNVDAVVEGSVLRSGNQIRITAQLIDARSDKHLWAQSFEGQANDIFALQDTVAHEIAAQTQVALTATDRTRLNSARTIRPEAHDDYLRGLYFIERRDAERAAQYFRSAIDIDPAYASGWAGLAQALLTEATTNRAPANDVIPTALQAAKRAIELDPESGEAYIALGAIEFSYLHDWAAAERPGEPLGPVYLSLYLVVVNRPDEAVASARRALELDPLGFFANRTLAQGLFYDRHYEEALAVVRRTAELAPDRAIFVEGWNAAIAEVQGRYADAVNADLHGLASVDSPDEINALRTAFAAGGWKEYQRARIRFLLPKSSANCNSDDLAWSYLRLGNVPEAFRWFQRETDARCVYSQHLAADPRMDPYRHDPHYLALQDRLHLPH
jgi:TolB-like protein/DNA-binding winged helix-turn-helix (wHTH) protein